MNQVDDLQRQLAEVQSQLAFQEDTIQALNEALAEQQREILVLRRQLELLQARQQDQAAALEHADLPGAATEKPPHY